MATIVAMLPPDATKAPRRIDKTPLNPDGKALRKFERDGTDRIHTALQYWARSLFRGVTADSVALIMARIDDPEMSKPLRDAMILFLQDVADAGAEHGRKQVERVIMGVKRTPVVDVGLIDWTLANMDAAQWAIEYGYQLIRGITDTTRAQVAREIRYFVDNSITIGQLRDRLMAGNLFSRNRAESIAVTEVTRSFAEGNMAAWRASKVVEGREWQTALDEIVCPLCGPLHGKIAKMGESFGPVNNPPRHVRCRCYTLPVVIGDTEVFPGFDELMGTGGSVGRVPIQIPNFKNIEDALAWAKGNLITDIDIADKVSIEWLQAVMDVLTEYENRSGKGIGSVVTFDANALGFKRNKSMLGYLDAENGRLYFKTRAPQLKRHLADNELYMQRYGKPFAIGETPGDIVWHEIGHSLDFRDGWKHSEFMNGRPIEEIAHISAYAMSDYFTGMKREGWAEAVAAFVSGDTSRMSQPILDYLQGVFQ